MTTPFEKSIDEAASAVQFAASETLKSSIAFGGIDIGKNPPRRRISVTACNRAEAEMVAGPGGSAARELAAVSDRHGGLPHAPEPAPVNCSTTTIPQMAL